VFVRQLTPDDVVFRARLARSPVEADAWFKAENPSHFEKLPLELSDLQNITV
jgi:hypothetical protein